MNFSDLLDLAEAQSGENLRKVKIAVLGSHATQLATEALRAMGRVNGIAFDIYEAEYDQIEMEIINPDSELYRHNPEFVLVLQSALSLLKVFYGLNDVEKRAFSDTFLAKTEHLMGRVFAQLPKAKVLFANFEYLNDRVFGNFYGKASSSFVFQVTSLNYGLMRLCERQENLYLLDVNALVMGRGSAEARDWAMYVNSDMHFSMDFYVDLAKEAVGIVNTVGGRFYKCIILDLDNTLWGGVIGDDGLANIEIGTLGIGKAFSLLQKWLKQLQQRGIILAVCSKNNEDTAKEPFASHEEMVLRLDDISVFIANWNNKADNIRLIQEILNIGFDSMVFLDDNPAEREIVRVNIPEICVPELPEDPALYFDYLVGLNLFETTAVSDNDAIRTKQYQEEAERKKLEFTVTNMDEYLESLQMKGSVEPFAEDDFSRISQLSLRSNQFNLRTVRYSVPEIREIAGRPDYRGFAVKLQDKFGDYGLISILVIRIVDADTAFLETWLMSCRVLKRGVEEYVLNALVAAAKAAGCRRLLGEYLPTPKNKLVEKHYDNLGFEKGGDGRYVLDLEQFAERKTHIK